jgi:GNAT superfamily N-acetyltransferase
MEIKRATTDDDFLKCWDVVHELRPNLTRQQYEDWLPQMEQQGYRMIYIEEDGRASSFCGYRYQLMLHRGPSFYVDDLCTLPSARGKGQAGKLLDYVIEQARKEKLQSIHLDSGHGRYDAHRLYLNKKFRITSHHFGWLQTP